MITTHLKTASGNTNPYPVSEKNRSASASATSIPTDTFQSEPEKMACCEEFRSLPDSQIS